MAAKNIVLPPVLLESEQITEVQVAPVVIFQVIEAYLCRAEHQESVIGTLMGTVSSTGVATITSSFPVPYSDQDDVLAIGQDYHRDMVKLHNQANKDEVILGWFSTPMDAANAGERINEQSVMIHDFYAQECANPVYLVVDTLLGNEQLSVEAYITADAENEKVLDEEYAITHQFKQLPVAEYVAEHDAIALNVMTKQNKWAASGNNGDVLSVPSEMDALESAMKKLYSLLETSSKYVDDVVAGKIANPDSRIARHLADALNAIPHTKPHEFNKMFNNSLQDLLMVSYISSLTQAQLCMAEKLVNRQEAANQTA